jgi:hypothetical protein
MSDLAETKLKSRDWNPRQLALYFVLAYGFSLALWLPMLLGRSHSSLSFSVGTFGPTLAALATHWIFTRNRGSRAALDDSAESSVIAACHYCQ